MASKALNWDFKLCLFDSFFPLYHTASEFQQILEYGFAALLNKVLFLLRPLGGPESGSAMLSWLS